ncbi:MAG: 2-dehydropantoate 2-reductase, partial [Planctomycetes bacterium]|nr:2-dehydropantoate 2-reductase [Planctomycetota bacterium]
TLVGREPLVAAVCERGLKLRLGGGARVVRDNLRPVTALTPGEAPDLLLVTVKSFSLGPALEQIKAAVTPRTVIVSLQNGLDNELAIRTAFPDNPVLAGAICAYLDSPAPGEVVCADDRVGLGVGSFDGDSEMLARVAGWLRWSGMEVATALDGMALKWSKLVLNVAFNALNAATGLDAGDIMAHREYGPLAAAALKEAFAAMAAEGIKPVDLPGYPVRKLRLLCRLPAPVVAKGLARATRGANHTVSSMRQDLRRGRGVTEIQGINGAVVASAARHGVPAPANQRLVKMVEDAVARGLPHDADGGAA